MTYHLVANLNDRLWEGLEPLRWSLLALYLLLLAVIAIYGLHRYWLVFLFLRHGRREPVQPETFADLPPVTVQLPLYDEATVAERAIDAVCRLDYPADRCQIQVLDDSTGPSAAIARDACARWARAGVDIQYLHRRERTGFKAGALAAGMGRATGQFIAVFDADFVAPAGFLRQTIHHFTDPEVGMVQARWGHLNRGDSMLTRCQALFLDGHFLVEHTARNRSRCWMNFNGTAGIWRRDTITSAGGWQHDTLTEDLDLSYRSQLAGWRFVYLPDLVCPAELPPEILAFKSQQHRWTKGSIQTALKILPRVLRAPVPARVKVEAFFHLTCPLVYVCMTLLAMLAVPVLHLNVRSLGEGTIGGLLLGLLCLVMGIVSVGIFYLASQRAQRRSLAMAVLQVPVLMALGVGIAVNNARACVEALLGHQSPFVRTTKYAVTATVGAHRLKPRTTGSRRLAVIELLMGAYTLACARIAMGMEHALIGVPFLLLFAGGYLYVGLSSLLVDWQARRQQGAGVRVRATGAARARPEPAPNIER